MQFISSTYHENQVPAHTVCHTLKTFSHCVPVSLSTTHSLRRPHIEKRESKECVVVAMVILAPMFVYVVALGFAPCCWDHFLRSFNLIPQSILPLVRLLRFTWVYCILMCVLGTTASSRLLERWSFETDEFRFHDCLQWKWFQFSNRTFPCNFLFYF